MQPVVSLFTEDTTMQMHQASKMLQKQVLSPFVHTSNQNWLIKVWFRMCY